MQRREPPCVRRERRLDQLAAAIEDVPRLDIELIDRRRRRRRPPVHGNPHAQTAAGVAAVQIQPVRLRYRHAAVRGDRRDRLPRPVVHGYLIANGRAGRRLLIHDQVDKGQRPAQLQRRRDQRPAFARQRRHAVRYRHPIQRVRVRPVPRQEQVLLFVGRIAVCRLARLVKRHDVEVMRRALGKALRHGERQRRVVRRLRIPHHVVHHELGPAVGRRVAGVGLCIRRSPGVRRAVELHALRQRRRDLPAALRLGPARRLTGRVPRLIPRAQRQSIRLLVGQLRNVPARDDGVRHRRRAGGDHRFLRRRPRAEVVGKLPPGKVCRICRDRRAHLHDAARFGGDGRPRDDRRGRIAPVRRGRAPGRPDIPRRIPRPHPHILRAHGRRNQRMRERAGRRQVGKGCRCRGVRRAQRILVGDRRGVARRRVRHGDIAVGPRRRRYAHAARRGRRRQIADRNRARLGIAGVAHAVFGTHLGIIGRVIVLVRKCVAGTRTADRLHERSRPVQLHIISCRTGHCAPGYGNVGLRSVFRQEMPGFAGALGAEL